MVIVNELITDLETAKKQIIELETKLITGPAGVAKRLNEIANLVHQANINWWLDIRTKEPIQRNVGELLMLTVSELAESMEGHRKGLMDDKLPHRPMFEVELADAIIRIFDLAAGMDLDLGGAFVEKMEYNAQRADHKHENRIKEGGKKY